ncbi:MULTISPECIES: cell division protein [Lactobacillus]|uniref:Cell division protein n=1 Tax=Lactobacillus xujianguonis TaxID=2495899 RepID=A0A437SSP9_9LACO|nr:MULTISPECIES: cell division protein [Lactobacillus]RVU69872.1 cell division protein [Lactobacillus xujianguonis]RVU73863.1 cell division protein [Lactobacillus xujianguonis]
MNFNYKKVDWNRVGMAVYPYVVILIGIYLMIRYQILTHSVLLSSDALLHFQRFYETKMQIKTGNFSYFQTNFAFSHSGRIFNAVYAPFLAYLGGLMLLIVHNWFNFQILTIFIVLLIAGIRMYRLALKAKVDELVAILLALLYLQFGIPAGILRFNFMAWGAALAPYAMMQVLYMIEDRKKPIHWLSMALIMSLLAQVHLLSTVFIACTYVPFAIYGLVKTTEKKQMIIDFLKAIGTTLVLTANIWGAMLVLFVNNKIALPNQYNLIYHTVKYKPTTNIHGALLFTMVILLVFQLIYVLTHLRQNVTNTLITFVAMIILLISSKAFPWARLQALYPRLGSSLQFPYRLMVGAWPLLLLGIGISMTYLMKNVKFVNVLVILSLVFAFGQNLSANYAVNRARSLEFLNPHHVVIIQSYSKITKHRKQLKHVLRYSNSGKLFKLINHLEPDYLPYTKHASNLTYQKQILDQRKHYHYAVDGSKLILTWHSKKTQKRTLPIVMYHQSRLTLNGKQMTKLKQNTITQPIIKAKKGKNVATLQFMTPTWFKILLVISIVGWMLLLFYGVYVKQKKVSLN